MFEALYSFSTKEEYQIIRERIKGDLQEIPGLDNSFLMEVAINEAVNNALCSSGDKLISICIRVTTGGRLIVRIKDQGDGFNGNIILQEMESRNGCYFEERLLNESGRGLSIMKCVTDKIFYNRQGNELLLMKYLNRAKVECQEKMRCIQ